jgi:hypothetical protein
MVQPIERHPDPASLAEDHQRWLEAMAEQYEQLIPSLRSDSRRRHYQLRVAAYRNRAEKLRLSAPGNEKAG